MTKKKQQQQQHQPQQPGMCEEWKKNWLAAPGRGRTRKSDYKYCSSASILTRLFFVRLFEVLVLLEMRFGFRSMATFIQNSYTHTDSQPHTHTHICALKRNGI